MNTCPPSNVLIEPDRRWLSMCSSTVPLDQAASVECLSLDYGAPITDATDDSAALVAQLRHDLDVMRSERDAAVTLADEYAAMLEGQAAA